MRKALVVIDMQNDFLDGVLGNERCMATVPEVVNLIENGGYNAVIYSQDTHDEDYLETQEGKRLPMIHCVKNTSGWNLNKDVENAIANYHEERRGSVFSFRKTSFGGLVFADICMKELEGFDEIHFCGVCTGICVISNVIIAKAAVPNVRLCLIDKACACVTEETHEIAKAALKTCQVDII